MVERDTVQPSASKPSPRAGDQVEAQASVDDPDVDRVPGGDLALVGVLLERHLVERPHGGHVDERDPAEVVADRLPVRPRMAQRGDAAAQHHGVLEAGTQFVPHSELFVNLRDPVESITVPEGQLQVTAEWYFAKSIELDTTGRLVLVPVHTRLDDDFVTSEVDRTKRGVRRREFPLKVAAQPGNELQLTIPGDHPDTIDGIETPPLFPPVGGGGLF